MPSVREIIEALQPRLNTPPGAEVSNMLRAYAESIDKVVKGKEILVNSSARQICENLVAEKHWTLRENQMVGRYSRRERGAFLELRGMVGGTADPFEYYFGEMVLVGGNSEDNSVTVYSENAPRVFYPNKKGKWGSQKTLEKAVRAGMDNPGKFQWMEGLMGEEYSYRT